MRRRLLVVSVLALAFWACKSRPDGEAGLFADQERAPATATDLRYLYHFGNFVELSHYATSGVNGMTERDWASIRSTTSQLSFRRGFYAAREPAFADQYALRYLFDPDEATSPWMIRVTLKASCLAPSQVVKSVLRIDQDPTFAAWYAGATKPERFRNFGPDAFVRACQFPVDWLGVNVGSENDCTRLLNDFYASKGIGLVEDHWWPPELGFWLVRRRDCVESVQAGPEQILAFAASPTLWKTYPDGQTRRSAGGEGAAAVVLKALVEVDRLDANVLTRLEASVKESDLDQIGQALPPVLQAAKLCEQAGKKVAFDAAASELFAAAKRVKAGSDVQRQFEFRKLLGEFASTRLPRLEASCQMRANVASRPSEEARWFLVVMDSEKIPASTARAAYLASAPEDFRCKGHRIRQSEVYCRPDGALSQEALVNVLPAYVKEARRVDAAPEPGELLP